VLTAMPAAGIPLDDIIDDCGYAHRDAGAWAIPLRRAGAQLVQDLHPHDLSRTKKCSLKQHQIGHHCSVLAGVADDHSMSFFVIALVIGALLCPGVTGVAPVGKMHSVSDMQDGSQFTDEEEEQGGWRRPP
jgi:hypothetical protein